MTLWHYIYLANCYVFFCQPSQEYNLTELCPCIPVLMTVIFKARGVLYTLTWLTAVKKAHSLNQMMWSIIFCTHTYNLPTAAVNVIIKSNTIIIFTFIIIITIDRFGQQAFSQSMHAKCLKMIPFHIFKYCVGLQLVCLDEVDNQCTR